MRWFLSLAAVLALAAAAESGPPPGDTRAEPPPDPVLPDTLDTTSLSASVPILDATFDEWLAPVPSSGSADALHYRPLNPEPVLRRFDPGTPVSALDLLSGGLQGGLAGALVGGGFAYAVQASTGDAERETAFAGTVIGWTLGSTIGIHLANRREGNLAKLLAGSYLLAAGVAILAVNTDSEGLFIPFAMLQLGGGIVAAQGTHRDGTR